MTKRDKILQVAGRINELRAELARLEAEFAELVPDDQRGGVPETPTQNQERAAFLPSRILSVINSDPGRSFAAPELVLALGIDPGKIDQVRATLFRLKEAAKVRKVRKGKYRALPPPRVKPRAVMSPGDEAHAVAG